MIADALRFEVEAHAHRTLADNPLLRRAASGHVGPEVVGRYLASLRFLLAITQEHLRRARHVARAAGLGGLSAHFAQKIVEERGHDRWAAEDLLVLARGKGKIGANEPVPAVLELSRFISATIEKDPRDYLAYVLWAEYFTVLVGGEFIERLVARCGIEPEALTCLARHVELDQEHTDEGLDFIDRFVADPERLAPMREVLRRAIALFDRACEEMLDPTGAVIAPLRRAVG